MEATDAQIYFNEPMARDDHHYVIVRATPWAMIVIVC